MSHIVLPHARHGRTSGDKLRSLSRLNLRLAPQLAQTMLGGRRAEDVADRFNSHLQTAGYQFTSDSVSNNLAFIAPLLTDFAARREGQTLRYLEIGAYEGRNLAFMSWLLPERLDVTVIDPWFNEDFNPDQGYIGIEARYRTNMTKARFHSLRTRRSTSEVELPKMLAAGEKFDIIYVDGSHAALAVMSDMCFAASLLEVGGMLVLDDYWHDVSEISGPGVKQAVDHFLAIFGDYFSVDAVYRQVVVTKTRAIPR